jgi:hypothetical protein
MTSTAPASPRPALAAGTANPASHAGLPSGSVLRRSAGLLGAEAPAGGGSGGGGVRLAGVVVTDVVRFLQVCRVAAGGWSGSLAVQPWAALLPRALACAARLSRGCPGRRLEALSLTRVRRRPPPLAEPRRPLGRPLPAAAHRPPDRQRRSLTCVARAAHRQAVPRPAGLLPSRHLSTAKPVIELKCRGVERDACVAATASRHNM